MASTTVDVTPGVGAAVKVNVPAPEWVAAPASYENTDEGIAGPDAGVNSLIKTCEVQPKAATRVSVTATGEANVVVNVEGKLTFVPRLSEAGAEIVSAAGGTLLVTVSVNCVDAACAEIIPIEGDEIIIMRANIRCLGESFMCEM